MKYIALLFFSISAFGCSTPKAEVKNSTETETQTTTTSPVGPITTRDISRFPDIQNENNLNKIIKQLESSDCVNEKGIGFAAEYTRTYALYERMTQLATENQLFSLLNNKSAIVRVYAFKGLKEMKYPSTSRAKLILDSDTNHVCWFVGCVKSNVEVSSFSKSEE